MAAVVTTQLIEYENKGDMTTRILALWNGADNEKQQLLGIYNLCMMDVRLQQYYDHDRIKTRSDAI